MREDGTLIGEDGRRPYVDGSSWQPTVKNSTRPTLRIIEQLQLDANVQLTEVAKSLQINPKTLSWHYRAHVLGRGLLKGYTVNWIGTGYDHRGREARPQEAQVYPSRDLRRRSGPG